MRLGRRAALTTPQQHTMSEVVAIMTGAARGNEPTSDPNQTVG
jgi:fructose transport system ATP-binding protein